MSPPLELPSLRTSPGRAGRAEYAGLRSVLPDFLVLPPKESNVIPVCVRKGLS